MTKKLKNLSLSLTCVRQLLAADGTPLVAEATFPSQGNPRQREPSVYGWQIKSAQLAGQQKSIYAKPVELGLCPKKTTRYAGGFLLSANTCLQGA